MRIGIVNVTGYAGAELARILARHPAVELAEVTGRSAAGQPLGSVFPHLAPLGLTVQAELENVDLAFSALPHHASAEACAALVERGIRVVDISADFRLRSLAVYEAWYGPHPAPGLLEEAVYGLPELWRAEVPRARLVANPGCYPTTSILGLAPIAHLIEPEVIVDAKSGISGAGRTYKQEVNHYCEINESVAAYGLKGHRHQPEIEQELNRQRARRAPNAEPLAVTFTPHLVPMTRGILATCYARLREPLTQKQLRDLYGDFYAGEPFVQVVNEPPYTKQVWGSNYCFVYPLVDERTGQVRVISVTDNLVKGAAGQAVQNMNLMLGLPERTGLDFLPVYP